MKPASALLIVSIGLGSLTGCGTARPSLPPPPAVLILPDCPSPSRPALPRIDGSLPFDAPANVKAIMDRDDALRLHVKGQEAALDCFRSERQGKEEE